MHAQAIPEKRVAALRKLMSPSIYADELCFGPGWSKLLDGLASCMAAPVSPGRPVDGAGTAADVGVCSTAAAQAAAPGDVSAVSVDTDTAACRHMALSLLARVVPEVAAGSPPHAAELLASMEAALLALRLHLPTEGAQAEHRAAHAALEERHAGGGTRAPGEEPHAGGAIHVRTGEAHAGGGVGAAEDTHAHRAGRGAPCAGAAGARDAAVAAEALRRSQPDDVQLLVFTRRLLAALARDWHLLKRAQQQDCAACVIRLLAHGVCAPASPDTGAGASEQAAGGSGRAGGHGRAGQGRAGAGARQAAGAGHGGDGAEAPAVARAMAALLLLDPSLRWWQRLCSAGCSTQAVVTAAEHAQLPAALLHTLAGGGGGGSGGGGSAPAVSHGRGDSLPLGPADPGREPGSAALHHTSHAAHDGGCCPQLLSVAMSPRQLSLVAAAVLVCAPCAPQHPVRGGGLDRVS